MKRGRAVGTTGNLVEARNSSGVSISVLLDAAEREPPQPALLPGVAIGTLIGLEQSGAPLVDFPGNPVHRAVIARSTVAVGEAEVGGEVALMFDHGDPRLPILIGAIRNPETSGRKVTAIVDGERVVVTAEDELVLQCGAASITLTRAGKILIRGKYLLSRSSGMNRIKGASVELN
jgi:Domain of unknown function (DUF6484)